MRGQLESRFRLFWYCNMPFAVFASAKPHGTRAFARLFVHAGVRFPRPFAGAIGTLFENAKLIFPPGAVETASAAVLRRSGLAAVKMVCARSCLHELFKGPVAAGSKVYRRSPPFCFWAQKSGVLISPKGKRERRRLRCRIQFSMCRYLGGGLHGKVEACQSSIRK